MESQRDCNVTVNIGDAILAWRTVSLGGGEAIEYDKTIPGQPYEFDVCPNSSEPNTITIETLIRGDDQAARDAIYSKFKKGTSFTMANPPTGPNQMWIDGDPDDVGTVYTVVGRPQVTHTYQETSTMTVELKSNGVVGGGTGTGTG